MIRFKTGPSVVVEAAIMINNKLVGSLRWRRYVRRWIWKMRVLFWFGVSLKCCVRVCEVCEFIKGGFFDVFLLVVGLVGLLGFWIQ